MIKAVYGLPGSGKTTLLSIAAYKWTHGKTFLGIPPADYVFTNFSCPGCYKLDFDALGLYNFCSCNIIIDEIMLLCDCRAYKSFPDHLRDFFALHRRSKTNVLWCSQSWNDTDLKIKNLTEEYFKLELCPVFPFISIIKPIVKELGIGKKGDSYTISSPLQWIFIFRPRWYKLFDSYESKLHSLPPPVLELWDSFDKVEVGNLSELEPVSENSVKACMKRKAVTP